jgi:hypothetical protein
MAWQPIKDFSKRKINTKKEKEKEKLPDWKIELSNTLCVRLVYDLDNSAVLKKKRRLLFKLEKSSKKKKKYHSFSKKKKKNHATQSCTRQKGGSIAKKRQQRQPIAEQQRNNATPLATWMRRFATNSQFRDFIKAVNQQGAVSTTRS